MATLEHPVLSDFDQSRLWESLIGAETRAQYCAGLVQRLRTRQRWLTIGSLILSSGAAIALLTTVVPGYMWAKGALALASAILSAVSLVSSNEKNAIEAADLSYRWQSLALEYQNLWSNMYDEDAPLTLRRLFEEEAKVSKSSTALPNDVKWMTQAEDNVTMHYAQRLAA
jgi:hypothetical protein